MKHTRYSLRLDSPCSQPWEGMTSTATGRYCHNCAKNVVDLTTLTDDQILTLLKTSGSTFCGRVTDAQLNRALLSRTETTLAAWLFKVMAGVFLLAPSDSAAQELIERTPTLLQLPRGSERRAAQQAQDPAFSHKAKVRAQLLSADTRQPVPDAYVSVMAPLHNGTSRSGSVARSDAEGYFDIAIPDSLVDQPARLVIYHPSYARQQVPLRTGAYPEVIELLPPPPPVIISTGGLVVEKRKWWQFWRRKNEGCTE
jgi:hypothetical protein